MSQFQTKVPVPVHVSWRLPRPCDVNVMVAVNSPGLVKVPEIVPFQYSLGDAPPKAYRAWPPTTRLNWSPAERLAAPWRLLMRATVWEFTVDG